MAPSYPWRFFDPLTALEFGAKFWVRKKDPFWKLHGTCIIYADARTERVHVENPFGGGEYCVVLRVLGTIHETISF